MEDCLKVSVSHTAKGGIDVPDLSSKSRKWMVLVHLSTDKSSSI